MLYGQKSPKVDRWQSVGEDLAMCGVNIIMSPHKNPQFEELVVNLIYPELIGDQSFVK